jgi:Tol biopolymer transport system component
VESRLEVISRDGRKRRVVYHADKRFETPNWLREGRFLLSRSGGEIYTLPVEGGEERGLTEAAGLDDGLKYSSNGQCIYFNSERTGWMQIWRMWPDGTPREQVTHDDYPNWFAHPSPDGKWLVSISFGKHVKGQPPNQNVLLRLMPV